MDFVPLNHCELLFFTLSEDCRSQNTPVDSGDVPEKEILGNKLKRRSSIGKQIIIFLLVSACLFGVAFMLRLSRGSLETESELDKLPQIIENDGQNLRP